VDQAIKTATDKAKPTVSGASKLGKLARGAKALSVAGLGLNVADAGAKNLADRVPSKQTERGKRQLGAAKEAAVKTMSKNTERDAKTNQAKRVAERNALKNMADKKRVNAATQANKTDNQRKSLEQDKKLVDAATKTRKTDAARYNVGKSQGGVSFKEAFAHFRKKGAKTFTWNGKKYTTELKK
jgi:DNA-binding beta-propeller fold protein YncE